MSQLPQDPQRLAQDILAGRVTIQQLQAEQARRRAAQEAQRKALRPGATPLPAGPRQASPRQVVAPSSGAGRAPLRPQRKAAVVGSSVPAVPATKAPAVQKRAVAPAPAAVGKTAGASPAASAVKEKSDTHSVGTAPRRTPAQTIRAVMHNPISLRSVFVLSELLNKPLSLREDPLDRF